MKIGFHTDAFVPSTGPSKRVSPGRSGTRFVWSSAVWF